MNGGVILVIVSVAAIIFWPLRSRTIRQADQAKENTLKSVARLMDQLIDQQIQIKLIVDETPDLALERGEGLIFVLPNATIYEPRAVRTWQSAYGGPSIRIAKGVSYHFGQSRGASESRDELRALDCGSLILTPRLLFIGLKRTVSAALQSFIEVDSYIDGVRIHLQKNKSQTYLYLKTMPKLNSMLMGRLYQRLWTAGLSKELSCRPYHSTLQPRRALLHCTLCLDAG
jgi:hypothetical protein